MSRSLCLLHILWVEWVYYVKECVCALLPWTPLVFMIPLSSPRVGAHQIHPHLCLVQGAVLRWPGPFFWWSTILRFFLLLGKLGDRSRHPGSHAQGTGCSTLCQTSMVCKGISLNGFPLWSGFVLCDAFLMITKPPNASSIYPPEPPAQRANSSNFGPLQNSRLTESESQEEKKAKRETD